MAGESELPMTVSTRVLHMAQPLHRNLQLMDNTEVHGVCYNLLDAPSVLTIAACVAPRTKAKAEAAAEGVHGAAQGGGAVKPVAGNLASLAEVRQLADVVKRSHPKLDVLINNAGAGTGSRVLLFPKTLFSFRAAIVECMRVWPASCKDEYINATPVHSCKFCAVGSTQMQKQACTGIVPGSLSSPAHYIKISPRLHEHMRNDTGSTHAAIPRAEGL